VIDAVDTPAPVVDVDRVERNIARWQAHCDRLGLVNRPHIKTHKSIEIARLQMGAGAAGVTCQKLGEAEAMVDGGIDDVLVTFNILGAAKLERLSRLLERATVAVTVDDDALLPGLARAAERPGRELSVLVDCDTGLGRTGVQTPAAAVELASRVSTQPPLRFEGFLTYPAFPDAGPFLRTAVEEANRRGLAVRVVSAGGTPPMWECERLRPTVTEYRVGTYAFHDRATVAAGAATLDDVALTVHATVVSRPTSERAILDAGRKALTTDPGPDDGYGLVVEAPASTIYRLDEEHAYVAVAPGDKLELGQVVRVVPNHACVVSNLFDEFVVARGDRVVGTWRIDARGRSS
jgi:D-serine deaminase-like pyridoxal phosphate-dependent protein